MNLYEELITNNDHVAIDDGFNLPGKFKGMYTDGVILIDKKLSYTQKLEVLAEELGHHDLTYGDIVDSNDIFKYKFELKARRCGFEKLITLDGIISASKNSVHNLYELANYFEVSESYIIKTLDHYKMKHGLSTYHNGYVIKFNPLQVFKHIEFN